MNEECWQFNYNPICEIPEGDWYGFVYKITNKTTKEYYYGCKSFYSITNPKISKKKSNEIYSGKGRKPTRLKKILKIPLPPLEVQKEIVAEIEAEQAMVNANRGLIERMEKKIQATLTRVWGDDK